MWTKIKNKKIASKEVIANYLLGFLKLRRNRNVFLRYHSFRKKEEAGNQPYTGHNSFKDWRMSR